MALALHVNALPLEVQDEIKTKIGESFHNGMWSAWKYNKGTRTLIVKLSELYIACDMEQQIVAILLHIDMGLVNTLVLQTSFTISISPLQSGQERIEWIEILDLNLFKDLVDLIDKRKVKKFIVDNNSID